MLYQFSSEFTYETTYVTQNFYVSKEHDPLVENEVNYKRIEKSSNIVQRRFLWKQNVFVTTETWQIIPESWDPYQAT